MLHVQGLRSCWALVSIIFLRSIAISWVSQRRCRLMRRSSSLLVQWLSLTVILTQKIEHFAVCVVVESQRLPQSAQQQALLSGLVYKRQLPLPIRATTVS